MLEYLDDVVKAVTESADDIANSNEFKAIYKNSLAAFVTLKSFSRQQLRLIRGAAELCRRMPVLVACRQMSEAISSLRRFVELIIWFPYFREHPVEWQHFESQPSTGYMRYEDNPIAWAAHREVGYYLAYITERSSCAATSVLAGALLNLQAGYKDASKAVHAGTLAVEGATVAPFDTLSMEVLKDFAKLQKSVFRAAIVVLSWSLPFAVHRLPAVERSWFDWLLKEWSHNARNRTLV